MQRVRIFLLFVVMMLAACMVGPNYERPDVPEPEAYRDAVPPVDSVFDLPAERTGSRRC